MGSNFAYKKICNRLKISMVPINEPSIDAPIEDIKPSSTKKRIYFKINSYTLIEPLIYSIKFLVKKME